MAYADYALYPGGNVPSKGQKDDCDSNPAFRFFGKRLFAEQTLPEFLNEFLLILFSPKRTEQTPQQPFHSCLPPNEILSSNPEGLELAYAPQARLNLKLLAFWAASRLNARHPAHRAHFDALRHMLCSDHLKIDAPQETDAVLRDLENLFLGLRSVGEDRTWCAQQFLPLCRELLTAETLWNEKEASKHKIENWNETFEHSSTFWTLNQHRFMARGGDVLYLQICLALSRPAEEVRRWNEDACLGLHGMELEPARLRAALNATLPKLLDACPGLGLLADFLTNLETSTAYSTDFEDSKNGPVERYQTLGWCSAESWREGYLFAVEVLRIAAAELDVMHRLDLLETACGLQILRTLAARTAALSTRCAPGWPGYLLPVTQREEKNPALRTLSHSVYKRLQYMQHLLIEEQLPHCTFVPRNSASKPPMEVQEARKAHLEKVSTRYGAGLYANMAKLRLGLVLPRTGRGERFVLPERVLRLLVLTLVPPGKSLRLDTFKQRIRAWHGFVFDAEGFDAAHRWLTDSPALFSPRCDTWLRDMLEDSNFLIHLSDACSLVHNPTGHGLLEEA